MDTAELETRDKIARLKAVRRQLGWSEETCAHQLGVTFSTLNRWERGESLPKSQLVLKGLEQFLVAHEPSGGP